TSLTLVANAASTNTGIAYHFQGIGPSDDATIIIGSAITMDVADAKVNSILMNGGGSAATITISGSNKLTVAGNTTCSVPTSSVTNLIAIGGGTFVANGLVTLNGGNLSKACSVTLGTGVLTLGAGLTFT